MIIIYKECILDTSMKFPLEHIVVIILFVLLISVLTGWSSSSNYVPYSTSFLFAKQFPYEGFQPMTEYTTYQDHASIDSYVKNNITEQSNPPYEKVRPYGLVSSPTVTEMPINIFGNDKGSPQCEKSIYSNSGGFLCLDDNQKKLLKTRGGNASGCSNQQVMK